ncbi:MAG: ABC transporter permease [Planctomycetaceae bacterium]
MPTGEKNRISGWVIDYLGLIGVLLLMVLVFSWKTEYFWTMGNLTNIANKIPENTVVAVGMTFVLIIGGIDLSVGAVCALVGMVTGVAAVNGNLPVPVAMLLGLMTGVFCGLINGMISERWRIPSFIVTLGMLEIARGSELLISNSESLHIGANIEYWGEAIPGIGITPAFFVAALLVILAQIVLTKTVYGRYMLAIGDNEEAVRLSGIRSTPVKVGVFAFCGFTAALAGLMKTCQTGTADPNIGEGLELDAIAAVVIGGTSLMGGRGSVLKSFLGVLIIAVLDSGLVQMLTPDAVKRIVTGSAIVLAVILDGYRQQFSVKNLFAKQLGS